MCCLFQSGSKSERRGVRGGREQSICIDLHVSEGGVQSAERSHYMCIRVKRTNERSKLSMGSMKREQRMGVTIRLRVGERRGSAFHTHACRRNPGAVEFGEEMCVSSGLGPSAGEKGREGGRREGNGDGGCPYCWGIPRHGRPLSSLHKQTNILLRSERRGRGERKGRNERKSAFALVDGRSHWSLDGACLVLSCSSLYLGLISSFPLPRANFLSCDPPLVWASLLSPRL